MSLEAIDRELAWVKEQAGAPQPVALGCSTISHDRLGFCCYCRSHSVPERTTLELMGWRLLALRDKASVNG